MTTTTSAPTTSTGAASSPDAQTTWVVPVRNDGLVVDSFAFEPIGTLADRAVVEPAELGLLPGQEGQVTVRYDLPTDPPLAAGTHPVGLRVLSREVPESGYVEEGALDIAPFTAVTAELGPRTSTARGRGKGKHEVALDNRGNTPAVVVLDLADPDEKLHGTIEPAFVEVGPGRSEIVTVKVHARAQHWKGANHSLPFQVVVTPPEGDQRTLPGTLLQRPLLPPWLLKALLGLLVLAMLMSGLWLAVLKPTIESSARAAASEEGEKALAAQQEAAAAQEKAAAEQKAALEELEDKVDAATTPTTPPTVDPGAPVDPLGDPLLVRVAATKSDQTPSKVVDTEKVVSITDLLLQNPAGDTGRIDVTRDGDVVYSARLENFRDLDLHLVAQLAFEPGSPLGLEVKCENLPADPTDPTSKAAPCTPGITVSGFARTPAP
jgi:hypothetical protein